MTAQEGGVDPAVILIAASIVGGTTIVIAFLGCMWCRNKWKWMTRRHYQFSSPEAPVQPPENVTEFTLFPPPSSSQFSLPTGISPDEVVFEPLPEIRSRQLGTTSENIRPARFTGSCEKISLQDWFDEHQVNFPRDHLAYFREVGPTWYGQAVEGEARGIRKSQEKTKVVVKILRVDATSTELMQFLQETRALRDLKHPNLLNLLNRCLEVHPFLLIMEHCDMDLKSYLIQQRKSPESLLKDGILLRMACNITAALQCMHEYGFIHMDVAAHSCLITSEGVVKLGDYGTAVHLHKSDFYCLGDVAFPIRWCAPESLLCTESIVEAKDITREANIWSFGVVLWELLEFGKLPYVNVSDNDVIQKVLIECCLRLEQPKTPCVHKDMIYKIMQLCWMPANLRPSIQKVSTLLNYLYDNRDVLSETAAFESRWDSLQPMLREHNLQTTLPNVTLRFESDFMPRHNDLSTDCDSVMSADFDRGAYGDKSPSSGSISMGELATDISPSLLNLRGSVEDLIVGGDAASGEILNDQRRHSDGLYSPHNDFVRQDNSAGQNNDSPYNHSTKQFDSASLHNNSVEISSRYNDSIKQFDAVGQHNNSVEISSPCNDSTMLFNFSEQHNDSVKVLSPYKNSNKLFDSAGQLDDSLEICSPCNSGEISEPLSLETIPASEASDSEAIQMRISEAIQDLDTILDDELASSETSDCNTPEKRPEGLLNSGDLRSNGDILRNGAKVAMDLQQTFEDSSVLKRDSAIELSKNDAQVHGSTVDN